MQLYYAKPSPFVRKVMIVLHEAGRIDDVELVDGHGSPVEPNSGTTSVNPVGKIPCLITDDGESIYDSRVITRYLDEQFGTGLYSTSNPWRTMTLEAMSDGILDAAVLCIYETRCRQESQRSAEWLAGQHNKIVRGLDALESTWLDHLNSNVDMGTFGAACVLDYLDFRHEMGGWPDWREGRPGIVKWATAFLDRPSLVSTRPSL